MPNVISGEGGGVVYSLNVNRAYPQLKGKKIILYAPTFRKGQALDPKELVRAFRFDGSCVLIIKRHPNQLLVVDNLAPALTCPGMPTSTVLSVCDCVITDYSAITIEAAKTIRWSGFFLSHHRGALTLTRGIRSTCGFTAIRRSVISSNAEKSSPFSFQTSGMPYETKFTPASWAFAAEA